MADIVMEVDVPRGLLQSPTDNNAGYLNAALGMTRDHLIQKLIVLESEFDAQRKNPVKALGPSFWMLKMEQRNKILDDLMGALLAIKGRTHSHLLIAFDFKK